MLSQRDHIRQFGALTLMVMYVLTMAMAISSPPDHSLPQQNTHGLYQTGTLLDYLNHTVPAQYVESDRSAPLLLIKLDHQKQLVIRQTLESAVQSHLSQLFHYVFGIPVKHIVSLILYPFHFFW